MSRRTLYFIIIVSVVGVVSWFFLSGSSLSVEHKTAGEQGIQYVSKEYSINEDEIEVESVKYWEEENRFAVKLNHINENTSYQIALRLNEDMEIGFILDVTGQFDEFGIAYCH